jgi:hypothetical protein
VCAWHAGDRTWQMLIGMRPGACPASSICVVLQVESALLLMLT